MRWSLLLVNGAPSAVPWTWMNFPEAAYLISEPFSGTVSTGSGALSF